MIIPRGRVPVAALGVGLILALGACGAQRAAEPAAPNFDEAFWRHWGDGQAELAGYALAYPRYGEMREGTAVTIFVTETFDRSSRVKSDDPGADPAGTFPVIKLNLIEDFPTGVYDYNLMTSTFVALTPTDGRPAGAATKVAFSSQEWCGQAFAQLLFDADRVRHVSHSYFDGEADREDSLAYPDPGVAEDALLLWARGLAFPRLERGESVDVSLLRSLAHARLRHRPLAWSRARLSRSAGTRAIEVPAGSFEVETLEARVEAGPGDELRWTFEVEAAAPHRLVRFDRGDGLSARLLGVARLRYWEMNAGGFEKALAELGLAPRPARTP